MKSNRDVKSKSNAMGEKTEKIYKKTLNFEFRNDCTIHVKITKRKKKCLLFLTFLIHRIVLFVLIYRVASGFPDMRSCLLNQKLQMLNVCMERKNIREGKLPFAMQLLSQQAGKADSDDEFFDCDDDRVVDDEGSHRLLF